MAADTAEDRQPPPRNRGPRAPQRRGGSAPVRRRLILWDIDGTLVHAGPAGREALERGAALAGGLVEVPPVAMSGKTDPQIVREIFTLAELADDHIERLMPEALAAVELALAAAEDRIRSDGRVLPGVVEVLERLAATGGVHQSLVTGNLIANAALKLTALGLAGYLDVEAGAYGTDHADRDRLVPIARERVGRLRGEQYRPGEVWVIGDTEHDLACARAAGVRCLLVGTGNAGVERVRRLPADAVLADLADTGAVLRILLGD
jgi:phosphoglycolate phosphatase-like HAD superfamily hydrolase